MKILFGILFLILPLPLIACEKADFLVKVCVSSQAQDLTGEEIAGLQCEGASAQPKIYGQLTEAFGEAPVWFQDRLCKLDHVVVYPVKKGTTISWSYPSLNTIGISKDRLDQNYTLAAQAAVMMKQAKGQKTLPEGMSLPAGFGYRAPAEASGLLYLFAHEYGHLLYNPASDEERRANFHSCNTIFGSYVCPKFKPGQFGFFDWIDGSGDATKIIRGTPKAENETLRSFITAGASVSYTPESAEVFFRGLHASSFVSTFALYSPEEDFCETIAHLVMSESGLPLSFTYLSGESFNIWDRIKAPTNPVLAQKLSFVRNLLSR